MVEKEGNYPRWIEKIEDATLRKNVAEILQVARTVEYRQRNRGRSDNDELALDISKENLRDKLTEIAESGDYQKSPLWSALMQIRPKIIGKRLPLAIAQNIVSELWGVKEEAEKSGEKEKAEFFRRLALQLNGKTLSRCTAMISGGEYEERVKSKGGKKGESKYHFFAGIPFQIRKEIEVKLTTNPDNFSAVVKAYEAMRDRTEGPARKSVEYQIEDMKDIFQREFSPREFSPKEK